jgi:hypothetical protein
MKGLITRCNNETEPEVLSKNLMGDQAEYMSIFRTITEDDYLFLYNFESFQFFGPYKPVGLAGNIDPKAWGGKFPSQIRFTELPESTVVPFNKVVSVIKRWHKDVYPWLELTEEQVKYILTILNK